MREPGGGEPVVREPRREPAWWPPTPRSSYLARTAAFVGVLVAQVIGLAADRTGELTRLRIAVIALAAVFLVATTVDCIGRSRTGL